MFSIREIIQKPLPYLPFRTRLLVRCTLLCFRGFIKDIQGSQYLIQCKSPFLVVANHTTYLEAILLPLVIIWLRGGERIHFMADWSFLFTPLVRTYFKAAQVIPVVQKPARPRFLNRFKDRVVKGKHGFALALDYLVLGKSIGIFPEAKAHQDPQHLRTGALGAARLALASRAPILPIGIQFPNPLKKAKVPHFASMRFIIEPAFHLDPALNPRFRADVAEAHTKIMTTLAEVSGKTWNPKRSIQPVIVGKKQGNKTTNQV